MSTDAPIRITLEQEEDYSFRIRFDDTTIADLMTDEPEPLGKGEGPNPTRLLVSAVANCLSASLLFALRKFRNTPGRLVTHATAELVRNEQGRLRVGHIHADVQRGGLSLDGRDHGRLRIRTAEDRMMPRSVAGGDPGARDLRGLSAPLWERRESRWSVPAGPSRLTSLPQEQPPHLQLRTRPAPSAPCRAAGRRRRR